MKHIILIALIHLTSTICFSQLNIFGVYLNKDGAFRQLDLKPDSSYIFNFQDRCGGEYNNSGHFKMILDTIFLEPNNTTSKPTKYLYISTETSKKNFFWMWDVGSLAKIHTSDSVLPINYGGRLTDYEALNFGSFTKQIGYYNDGKLLFSTEIIDEKKVVTFYYLNGQVKSIERFYKNQKDGDWYFYFETGQLEKIVIYKRDKIKREKRFEN